MEEFITQFKNNRIVRYSVLSGFILLAYLSVGAVAILIVATGLFLGRLSYNDSVDDLDIQGLLKNYYSIISIYNYSIQDFMCNGFS